MARNYFQGGGAMDVIGAGQAGWDDTQGKIDTLTRKRAAYRAGPKIASGDYTGAAGEYGAAGLDEEAATMRGQAEAGQDREYRRGRDARADERQARQDEAQGLEDAKARYEVMGGVLGDLDATPEGSRAAVLHARLPIFEHLGFPPELVEQMRGLTEADLTSDQLRAFGAKLDQEWQLFQTQGGGITAVNKRTRKSQTIREPDKPLIIKQGDTLLDPDTRRPIYTAPKTFAPRRAGSGGTAGAASLPPGYAPR